METAGQRREQGACPWVTLTTHVTLATSVHRICFVKSRTRFPGSNRICIEPVDSDKCTLGVKCSLSLFLLQNQENKPLIPEVIMSEFSVFSSPPRYCEFLGLDGCFAVNTTAFLYGKSVVLWQY